MQALRDRFHVNKADVQCIISEELVTVTYKAGTDVQLFLDKLDATFDKAEAHGLVYNDVQKVAYLMKAFEKSSYADDVKIMRNVRDLK